MILKEITIKNFKILKEHNATFDDKFNLIIGKNGTGKTAMLEAINIGLGGFFSDDDIRLECKLTEEGKYDITYHNPTIIQCSADTDTLGTISWVKSTTSNYITIPTQNKEGITHIISYHGINRILNQEDKKIIENEPVMKSVCKFIKLIEDKDINSSIFYDEDDDELMFLTNDNIMPLRLMSSGYKNLIYMVANIAYEMLEANVNLGDEVTSKTHGIVMIDEIDFHTHPRWQWHIIDALTETFPSVQFIATTNSPIVISSCQNKNVISLSEKNVFDSPYGWQINDVLNEFMETDDRTPKLSIVISELEDLIKKNIKEDISEEEKLNLKMLKQELDSIFPRLNYLVEEIENKTYGEMARNKNNCNC